MRCTAVGLVGEWEASWSVLPDGLRRWAPTYLHQTFPTHARLCERQWILAHLRDHEVCYGGELFV